MDRLIEVRETILRLYARYSKIVDKGVQFILALATFMFISSNIEFMKISSDGHTWSCSDLYIFADYSDSGSGCGTYSCTVLCVVRGCGCGGSSDFFNHVYFVFPIYAG